MTLDQIRYLVAINQYHSLHQASDHLFITPQALSQSISALEKELKLKLIESSHKGTFLTTNGHILLDAGEEFMRIIAEMQDAANVVSYKNLPKANLEILTVSGMANTLMPKIIAGLYQEYPGIHLKQNTGYGCFRILEKMFDEELPNEFAFLTQFRYVDGTLPKMGEYPTLTFEPLISGRYCVSVPEGHEIYRYSSISLSTVLKYPILILSGTEDIIGAMLSAYGTPRKIILIDDYAVFNQMVQESNTYLTLNRMSSSFETSLAVNRRKNILLKEEIHADFGVVYRNDRPLSPVTVEFLDAVRRYCMKHYGSAEH